MAETTSETRLVVVEMAMTSPVADQVNEGHQSICELNLLKRF